MSGADHYEVLNVERTASTAEIKTAYRKLVRQVHPDQGGNAALFHVVQEAWTTLSDPAKRAAYDRQLARAEAPPGEPRTTTPPHRPEPEPADPFTWSTDQPWATQQPFTQQPFTRQPYTEQPYYEEPRRQPRYEPQYEQPYQHQPYEPGYEPTPDPLPAVDAAPIHATPPFGRLRLFALIALAGWTALLVGLYVSDGFDSAWDGFLGIGIAGMLLVAMPPHWSRRVPGRGVLKALGLMTAALYLGVALASPPDLTTRQRTLSLLLVIGLVVVRILTGRWSKAHVLDQAIDRQATYEFNLWGRPGEPLVNDALAVPLTPYDVLLQRRTASLLDPVLNALPAAKLVHSAQLQGIAVDHMLINGRRVALIVSLVGPPGTYSLDAYGSLVLEGQPIDSPSSALASTVEAWHRRLRSAEVRGFLLIHPTTAGRITAGSASNTPVTCISAQSAARDLLTWLESEGSLVDRRVLYDVLRRAPYA
ncbi:DnaJ domain-containing protein [Kribbella sp. NPDC048915]|uniref:J domain-containing protein n=1 Tax=Kribbella sp. NPDC048915 TaxID=3155148 RepID=UPI0033D6DE7D